MRLFINFRSKDGRLTIGSQPLAFSFFCGRVSLHCQSWTKNHGEKESIRSQRGADCLQLRTCTSFSLDGARGNCCGSFSANLFGFYDLLFSFSDTLHDSLSFSHQLWIFQTLIICVNQYHTYAVTRNKIG